MENQKGSVLVVVVITILSIAVAGLGGFVVYDKVIKTDNTVEEKTDNKDNNQNISDKSLTLKEAEIVGKFESKYTKYGLSRLNKNENTITNFNDLDNKQKIELAYYYLRDAGYGSDAKVYTSVFNVFYNNVFKDNIQYENEEIHCCYGKGNSQPDHCHIKYFEGGYYDYNPEVGGHGGNVTSEYYSKLINFEKVNDKTYKLTYVKLFLTMSEGGYPDTFYNKYNHNSENPTIEVPKSLTYNNPNTDNVENDIYEYVNKEMSKVKNFDDYPKYIYTVELSDMYDLLLTGYSFEE